MVAVRPTAATAAKNAYWVMVTKIWSGTPNTTPSAKAKQLAAAVRAQRPVSSAQQGPTISSPAVASALAAFAAAAGEIPDSQWPADPPPASAAAGGAC